MILLTVSLVSVLMVSHNRTTTFSKELKISFLKPRFRNSFQIGSAGFISGVAGGRKNRRIFEGTSNALVVCHDALSQERMIRSSGNAFDSSLKNRFMQIVLQKGITKKKDSPVRGSTAP